MNEREQTEFRKQLGGRPLHSTLVQEELVREELVREELVREALQGGTPLHVLEKEFDLIDETRRASDLQSPP